VILNDTQLVDWDPKLPFQLSGGPFSVLFKKTLNYICKKMQITMHGRKLIVFRCGEDKKLIKKKHHQTKVLYNYKSPWQEKVRYLLPRIRAGNSYFEVYFLRNNIK